MNNAKHINKALKLVRAFHNIKQSALARALDMSPSHLSDMESGKAPVTMALLQRYSNYFKLPVSSILYFSEHLETPEHRHSEDLIDKKAIKMLEWLETITRND